MKLTIEQYLKSLQSFAEVVERHPQTVGIHATTDILKIKITPNNLKLWLEAVIWNVTSTCKRCNDNGCPACDGTKGSQYNSEPY